MGFYTNYNGNLIVTPTPSIEQLSVWKQLWEKFKKDWLKNQNLSCKFTTYFKYLSFPIFKNGHIRFTDGYFDSHCIHDYARLTLDFVKFQGLKNQLKGGLLVIYWSTLEGYNIDAYHHIEVNEFDESISSGALNKSEVDEKNIKYKLVLTTNKSESGSESRSESGSNRKLIIDIDY